MATGPSEAAFPTTQSRTGRLCCAVWGWQLPHPPSAVRAGDGDPAPQADRAAGEPTLQAGSVQGRVVGCWPPRRGKGAGGWSAGHLGASTQAEAGWTLGVWAWELLAVGEPGLGVPSARPGAPGADALTRLPLGRPGWGGGGPPHRLQTGQQLGQHPLGGAAMRFPGRRPAGQRPEAGWLCLEGGVGRERLHAGAGEAPSDGVPW